MWLNLSLHRLLLRPLSPPQEQRVNVGQFADKDLRYWGHIICQEWAKALNKCWQRESFGEDPNSVFDMRDMEISSRTYINPCHCLPLKWEGSATGLPNRGAFFFLNQSANFIDPRSLISFVCIPFWTLLLPFSRPFLVCFWIITIALRCIFSTSVYNLPTPPICHCHKHSLSKSKYDHVPFFLKIFQSFS